MGQSAVCHRADAAYQQCMQNKEDVQMSLRIGANIIGVTIHR